MIEHLEGIENGDWDEPAKPTPIAEITKLQLAAKEIERVYELHRDKQLAMVDALCGVMITWGCNPQQFEVVTESNYDVATGHTLVTYIRPREGQE